MIAQLSVRTLVLLRDDDEALALLDEALSSATPF